MTVGPVNSESPYLPATQELSEELPQLQKELLTLYKRIATNVNTREIGRYDCVDQSSPVTPPGFERPTGQVWFGSDNQNQRTTFRKVVLFSGLTAGTNVAPHNLGDITGYTFTYIGGCYNNSGTAGTLEASVDATNVSISVPAAAVGGSALIVLEYIKN